MLKIVEKNVFAAPSGPPSNINLIVVTSTSVTFSWSEPACGQRNGQIVLYSYMLINEAGAVITNDETKSTGVSFNNLEPFTSYSFKVSARTQSAFGPTSMAVNITAEERG